MKLNAIPKMLAMIPSVMRGVGLADLERIKAITRATFPAVIQLSTEELASLIQRDPNSLLVVDVRSPKEFAVSHLPNAIRAESAEFIAKKAKEKGSRKVVLYCSVGFRSSLIANQLQRKGLSDISNLEGSIFAWANEGRPLFCGNHKTSQVHPYGNRWSGLLNPGLALPL